MLIIFTRSLSVHSLARSLDHCFRMRASVCVCVSLFRLMLLSNTITMQFRVTRQKCNSYLLICNTIFKYTIEINTHSIDFLSNSIHHIYLHSNFIRKFIIILKKYWKLNGKIKKFHQMDFRMPIFYRKHNESDWSEGKIETIHSRNWIACMWVCLSVCLWWWWWLMAWTRIIVLHISSSNFWGGFLHICVWIRTRIHVDGV